MQWGLALCGDSALALPRGLPVPGVGGHARDRFPHKRKHLARASVEEQWGIVHDEVLVKREPASTFNLNRRVDAVDPIGNFMHVRPRLAIRNSHKTLLAAMQ